MAKEPHFRIPLHTHHTAEVTKDLHAPPPQSTSPHLDLTEHLEQSCHHQGLQGGVALDSFACEGEDVTRSSLVLVTEEVHQLKGEGRGGEGGPRLILTSLTGINMYTYTTYLHVHTPIDTYTHTE